MLLAYQQLTDSKHRKKHYPYRPGFHKKSATLKRQIFILQGFPGVGPVRAKVLIEKFGSVQAVFSAGIPELKKVDGVGKWTAKKCGLCLIVLYAIFVMFNCVTMLPSDNTFTFMAEELIISESTDKKERYKTLIPQIESLVMDEKDLIANLSNITAALKQTMDFFWVGFYLVKENQLVLGPFQGPIACTRINFGKGVCGAAWKEKSTIVVPNVDEFPGHIACSSASRSEIVSPAFNNNEVALVLDVDSDKLADFDDVDREALEKVMKIVERLLPG